MTKLSSTFALATLFVAIFSPSTMVQAKSCASNGTVVLLRGGLGYMPESETLIKDLRSRGFRTISIRPGLYVPVAIQIRISRSRGKSCGPVILIGYSSGGDSACLLARELQKASIPVQTCVLIEPTIGVEVPSNVRFCWNLYESKPKTDSIPIFRGVAVKAETTRTALYNVDIRTNSRYAYLRELDHLDMPGSPKVQKLVVDLIASRHARTASK